jgi:hypothetical protein
MDLEESEQTVNSLHNGDLCAAQPIGSFTYALFHIGLTHTNFKMNQSVLDFPFSGCMMTASHLKTTRYIRAVETEKKKPLPIHINFFHIFDHIMALSGKVALITGGAKNLGADIARALAGVGADLAIHYNSASSKSDATKLEAELKQKYPSIKLSFYQGDLTSAGAVHKLFQEVVRDFKKVDIVINTVGKVLKKPITEISEAEYDSMFA